MPSFVIENITRHLEEGLTPYDAAMLGSKEIGFTVLSMSISLIAVFIPILLMGWHRGPALPRVCCNAFGVHLRLAGGFAHHHSNARGQVS